MPVSSWVESVEFINTTIGSTDLSSSYSLTKGQNYENCVPFFTVCGSQNYWDSRLTDVYFSGTTESGVINFRRYAQRGAINYIKCYVVEFNPEQVRVQQGSFDLAGLTTQTVTLPTTLSGTDRTAMTFGWRADDSSQHPNALFVRGGITSTSGVDFYRYNATNNCDGHWFLLEDLADNFRVSHFLSTFSSNGDQFTINADNSGMDLLRTFPLGSYAVSSATVGYATYWSATFQSMSNGTVRAMRSDSSSGTYIYAALQIFKFMDQSKVYTPFNHTPNITFSSSSYSTAVGGYTDNYVPFLCDLNSSSVVATTMQGLVRCDQTVSAQIGELMVAVELTASGTITYTKSGAAYTVIVPWTVAIDWAGIEVNTGTNSNPIPEGNGAGQSFVKSVENFRFTISQYFGAKILTKGQNVSNCVVFSSNRVVTDNDYITRATTTVRLLEPGVVCFWRGYGDIQTYVDVSVVEFYPAQVKVQQKAVSFLSTDTMLNVSIDEVSNVNKAFIISSIAGNYPTYATRYITNRVRFTDTTIVEVYKNTALPNFYYTSDCVFYVVEDLQNNFVTRHYSNTSASTADYFYNFDYNWGQHNSFFIVSYACGNTTNDYPSANFIRAYRSLEACPVVFDRGSANGSIYWTGTAIRFIDEKLHCQYISKTLGTPATVTDYYRQEFFNDVNTTIYNPCQFNSCYTTATATTAISECIITARILDYSTGLYEVSKTGTTYTCYAELVLINWTGYHYQEANNIEAIPTKSVIRSVQKNYIYNNNVVNEIWLDYSQDMSRCVPFVSSSSASSDGIMSRLYGVVFQYRDPDHFALRSWVAPSSNIQINFYTVEFNEDIKVQSGEGMSSDTTLQFTIEEVNLDRAFLHFFVCASSSETYPRASAVCGRFTSPTQIEFIRNYATGYIVISWYVVECPDWGDDSYWRVLHLYGTGLGNANTVTLPSSEQPHIGKVLYLASYTSDANNAGPYYSAYYCYISNSTGSRLYLEKGSSTYGNMQNCNIEAIEFSSELLNKGLKIYSGYYTLGSTTPLDVSLKLPTGTNFHIPRSILLNINESGMNRVDTATVNGWTDSKHYLTFKDSDGDDYSDTITAYKGSTTYYSYGHYTAIQFPDYNKYYFEGHVKEKKIPVIRTVRAYKTLNGELVSETTSLSGTGYFLLEVPDYEQHDIVALDDTIGETYNDLIYGNVYPTIISGSFAYKMGLVTVSGVEEGIPLLYQ